MEGISGNKRKFKESSTENDSDNSIVCLVNLGNPGHTLTGSSSSEDAGKKESVKKIRLHKKYVPEYSDSEDSDCQIVKVIPAPEKNGQDNNQNIESDNDSLCQNQLMDRHVANLYDEAIDYYADNDTDVEPENGPIEGIRS